MWTILPFGVDEVSCRNGDQIFVKVLLPERRLDRKRCANPVGLSA
jgi:hypothetical protein